MGDGGWGMGDGNVEDTCSLSAIATRFRLVQHFSSPRLIDVDRATSLKFPLVMDSVISTVPAVVL